MSSNLSELKQSCKEEWASIPPQWYETENIIQEMVCYQRRWIKPVIYRLGPLVRPREIFLKTFSESIYPPPTVRAGSLTTHLDGPVCVWQWRGLRRGHHCRSNSQEKQLTQGCSAELPESLTVLLWEHCKSCCFFRGWARSWLIKIRVK